MNKKHIIPHEEIKNQKIDFDGDFSIFDNLENFYILGGGFNTLITKDFVETLVLVKNKGIETIFEDDKNITVKIAAGEDWEEIVKWSIEKSYLGIQNLAMIPGTAGAAPIQNIGAYGSELKDVFESLEFYNFETKTLSIMNPEDCKFGYRESIFKNELKGKGIITSITLKLEKLAPNSELPLKYFEYKGIQEELETNFNKPYTLEKIYKAISNIRESKLPSTSEYGSCGSTFKNPIIQKEKYEELLGKYPELPQYPADDNMVKIPAAYILEKLGWKDKQLFDGKCGTWKYHPLIVVNYNDANSDEVLSVIREIQKDFHQNTGIDLETEINII